MVGSIINFCNLNARARQLNKSIKISFWEPNSLDLKVQINYQRLKRVVMNLHPSRISPPSPINWTKIYQGESGCIWHSCKCFIQWLLCAYSVCDLTLYINVICNWRQPDINTKDLYLLLIHQKHHDVVLIIWWSNKVQVIGTKLMKWGWWLQIRQVVLESVNSGLVRFEDWNFFNEDLVQGRTPSNLVIKSVPCSNFRLQIFLCSPVKL